MEKFAQNLMALHRGPESGQTDALFGSAARMAQNLDIRDRVRIALWPFVSSKRPHDALGLSAVFAFLLEQWQDATLYRLFVQFDKEAIDPSWRIEQSQFTVDEWQLESLDDNVAVWGTLTEEENEFALTIEMESELDDEDDFFQRTYKAKSLSGIVVQLPDAVRELAEDLALSPPLIAPYTTIDGTEESLSALLDLFGRWHVQLQETLWGKKWPERDAMETLQALVFAAAAIDNEFASWVAGAAAAHGMLPGYETIADNIAGPAAEIPEQFTDDTLATLLISQALFNAGQTNQAIDLMEDQVEAKPDKVGPWLLLGELYRSSGRFLDGLDAFQRAIESEATSKLLYLRYADLISIISFNGLTMDEYVLIDPEDYADKHNDELMTQEFIQGLEAASKLDPNDIEILSRQLRQYVLLQDTGSLWPRFERFLELNPDGSALRSVIDDMELLEDLEPLLNMLQAAIQREPERADLLLALATIHIYEGDETLAVETLERAEALTNDDDLLTEIDRLFLRAHDPEFETRLGDIQALVSAGSKLSSNDIDFLEDAIEEAPDVGEFYLLLGKAYRDLDDIDAGLETLLDGHEQVPDDPDILAALGEVLWQSDQKSLAFDYLNQGISAHPNHIGLLARTGQYLFESGQDEEARVFLARAEMINPRDPFLQEVRQIIARYVAGRGQ